MQINAINRPTVRTATTTRAVRTPSVTRFHGSRSVQCRADPMQDGKFPIHPISSQDREGVVKDPREEVVPGNESAQVENCQAPAGDLPAEQEKKELAKAEGEARRQEKEEQKQQA